MTHPTRTPDGKRIIWFVGTAEDAAKWEAETDLSGHAPCVVYPLNPVAPRRRTSPSGPRKRVGENRGRPPLSIAKGRWLLPDLSGGAA